MNVYLRLVYGSDACGLCTHSALCDKCALVLLSIDVRRWLFGTSASFPTYGPLLVLCYCDTVMRLLYKRHTDYYFFTRQSER